MAGTMTMAVNRYSVEWTEVAPAKACVIGAQCLGETTAGLAIFFHDDERIDQKRCCMACAMSECSRLGMQGAVTVKEITRRLRKVQG